MAASPDWTQVSIRADAARALGAWAFAFRARIRTCAAELARAEAAPGGPAPEITLETLRRAHRLACLRAAEAADPADLDRAVAAPGMTEETR